MILSRPAWSYHRQEPRWVQPPTLEIRHVVTMLPFALALARLFLHTGMGKGEMCSLRRDQADVKRGMVILTSRDTETDKGRARLLNQTLTSTLKTATR
jgi:hypothetical protein